MQGVTTHRFRALHAELFGGVDRYYTPFFSPTGEHRVTERDRRDLTPEHNDLARVVPQIMAKRPEDFLWAAELLRGMGYGEVNLNLGCPSGTVTGKGKGAGLLRDPAALAVFLETVYGALPDFEAACDRAGVPHTAFARPGMVHCYCMLPYFKEAREDFARITDILSK